jgi:hypothetical protein
MRTWGKLVGLARADNLFDSGGYVERTLRAFTSKARYDNWRGGHLDMTAIPDLPHPLREDVATDDGKLAFRGVAVVAADASIIWISVTSDETLLSHTTSERANAIRKRVTQFESPTVFRWTATLNEQHLMGFVSTSFATLARKIIHEHFGLPSRVFEAIDCIAEPGKGRRRVFAYSARAHYEDPTSAVRRSLSSLCEVQSSGDELVIVTDIATTVAISAAERVLEERRFNELRVQILGREGLTAYLGAAPWLVGAPLMNAGLAIVHGGDIDLLSQILLTRPMHGKLTGTDAAVHPAIAESSVVAGRATLIVGSAGEGKSVALVQVVARDFPNALVIVAPVRDMRVCAAIEALLIESPRFSPAGVVIVADDIHEEPSSLNDLLRFTRPEPEPVTVLAACVQSEYAALRMQHWQAVSRFQIIDLDHDVRFKQRFLDDVGRHTAQALKIPKPRMTHGDTVGQVVQFVEATEHDESADRYRWPAGSVAYWAQKFRRLLHTPGTQDQVALLLIVRIFRLLRRVVQDDDLRRCFKHLLNADDVRFQIGWMVINEDWYAGGVIAIVDVDPEVLGILDRREHRLGPVAEAVIAWLHADHDLEHRTRESLLWGAYDFLVEENLTAAAREVGTALVQSLRERQRLQTDFLPIDERTLNLWADKMAR